MAHTSVQCGGCGERGVPEGKGMMDLAGFGLVLPLLPWKVPELRGEWILSHS